MIAESTTSEELMRDLESTEATAWGDLYRAAPEQVIEDCGVRCWEPDGACISAAGSVDILGLNRVIGLGVERPATDQDIDRIVARYAEAGAARFFVQLAPSALPSELERRFEARGFRHHNNWMKLFREAGEIPPVETDLCVEPIGVEHATAFGEIFSSCFDWPPPIDAWIARTVGRPGWTHYLAFDGDRPVATAAFHRVGGSAWLDMASTLPEYRGRGAQSALLARRIRDLEALGIERLILETAEETPDRSVPSYRNALRFGFRVAYARPNYVLELAEEK